MGNGRFSPIRDARSSWKRFRVKIKEDECDDDGDDSWRGRRWNDDDSDDEGEQSGEENDEGTKNDEQQAIEIAYISRNADGGHLERAGRLRGEKRRKAGIGLHRTETWSTSMTTTTTKKKRKRVDEDDAEDEDREKENDFRTASSRGKVASVVVRPSGVGKSSLSKILINYAARQGWSPLFIDLDLGQNAISVRTVSAAPIDHPINPFEERRAVNSEMPLSYFSAFTVTENSKEHYKFLVEKIGNDGGEKLEE